MGEIYDGYQTISASAFLGFTQLSGCVFRDTAGAVNSRVEIYDGYLAAPSAPVATDTATAGNVNVGTHSWKVSFTTKDGETTPSAKSNVLTIASTAKKVNVTLPVGGNGTKYRKLYRTVAGDTGNYKLVATIANNVDTVYQDNTADAGLGADAPSANTSGTLAFAINIPAANGTESHPFAARVQMHNPTQTNPSPPYLLVANGSVAGAVFGR